MKKTAKALLFTALQLFLSSIAYANGLTLEIPFNVPFPPPNIINESSWQSIVQPKTFDVPMTFVGQTITAQGKINTLVYPGDFNTHYGAFVGTLAPGEKTSSYEISAVFSAGSQTKTVQAKDVYFQAGNTPLSSWDIMGYNLNTDFNITFENTYPGPEFPLVGYKITQVNQKENPSAKPPFADTLMLAGMTLHNKYKAYTPTPTQMLAIKTAAALLATGAVTYAIVQAGIAISAAATVGTTVAISSAVVATAIMVASMAGIVSSSTPQSVVESVLDKIAEFKNIKTFPSSLGLFQKGLDRLANDPPDPDYLTPAGPISYGNPDSTMPQTYALGGCLLGATTALERYQGALLANNFDAAKARFQDYQQLESCFVAASSAAAEELSTLANSQQGPVSLVTLKSIFDSYSLQDLTPEQRAQLETFASNFGISTEDFLQRAKDAISAIPDSVSPADVLNDTSKELITAIGPNWIPVGPEAVVAPPTASVSEPSSGLLLGLSLAAMGLCRRRIFAAGPVRLS